MKTGKRWSCWKSCLLGLPILLAGCATDRAIVEKNLMAQHSSQGAEAIDLHYCVGCPDVLALSVTDRSEFTGRYPIGPDGRIDLGDYGNPRVEGRTVAEITKALAEEIGVSEAKIDLRVAEYRSQQLILFGEVIGWQRSVPYQGQETVLDLVRRIGGITTGAEPREVYVVRPHMGDSQRPEVIHVDLYAIVMKGDGRTNIRLLPFDQIYVGETRRCQIEKAIPPWMRRPFGAAHPKSPISIQSE